MEAALASAGNPLVRYVDTGSEFLGPDGRYDTYLACLPTEGPAQGCGVPPAPAGEIQVRNADGTHFCVVGGLQANQSCPVYSSGVLRLAQVVAQATEGWTLPSAPATPRKRRPAPSWRGCSSPPGRPSRPDIQDSAPGRGRVGMSGACGAGLAPHPRSVHARVTRALPTVAGEGGQQSGAAHPPTDVASTLNRG